ncbi:hypothetical protein [Nocardia nova]|uniref:hypothetical protein n=1 Tax=Nocardia nova TaxID=37330 RepID=UPI00340D203D
MMRIRHLVLTGVVAASVAACGESASDSPETTSLPAIRTACDAEAANGAVFTTEARPDVPFTLQLPQLRAWQVVPADGDDLVLRRVDRHAGKLSGATVTLGVSAPRSAVGNTVVIKSIAGNWRQWRNQTVDVCGWDGSRGTGILSASGNEEADHYYEFLDFEYLAAETLYPIRMSVETPAADRDLYKPDIDTFVDGLQIVPTPPAG